MKKLLGILVLGLFLITPSQADDIRDFQIEGMSVGDSLLTYVEESFIIENSANIYPIEGYLSFVNYFGSDSVYDGYQVHYKKDDKKYIIKVLEGVKLYRNNINDCYDLRKKIVSEVKELFKDIRTIESNKIPADGDPSGNSTIITTRFYVDKNSKYEDIQISCYDWAKNFKFSNGAKAVDKLTVTISTDEVFEFLEKAYN